jgi:hypothetical protein
MALAGVIYNRRMLPGDIYTGVDVTDGTSYTCYGCTSDVVLACMS